MEKDIVLETERIILRKIKVEDAEEAFRNWTSDDEVSKYMIWSTHKTVEDTKQWLTEEEKNSKSGENYCFGIVLKETCELIGSMSYHLVKEEDRYEVGYGIGKRFWRNGYTAEALKCLMDFLIKDIGIKKFICRHAKLNPASGAVMQKVGFKYVKDGYYESFDKTKKYESKIYYLDIN